MHYILDHKSLPRIRLNLWYNSIFLLSTSDRDNHKENIHSTSSGEISLANELRHHLSQKLRKLKIQDDREILCVACDLPTTR